MEVYVHMYDELGERDRAERDVTKKKRKKSKLTK